MTIDECLHTATASLEKHGITTARLDALVLMEDILGHDRSWLLAHPETMLQGESLQNYKYVIARRAKHEPLAYIRGKSEFYGREFMVTPATLQPRSETETMIDLLKQLDLVPQQIIDVGTGSGCLAITAKLEWPKADVFAIEINDNALEIAKKNAKNLKADVRFYKGNLLEPIFPIIVGDMWLLLANLPYVPDSHTINKAAMQEPKIAIFGGEDGLDYYRQMFAQIDGLDNKPQHVFTESLPFQHAELAKIAEKHGFKQTSEEDFIQVFKEITE